MSQRGSLRAIQVHQNRNQRKRTQTVTFRRVKKRQEPKTIFAGFGPNLFVVLFSVDQKYAVRVRCQNLLSTVNDNNFGCWSNLHSRLGIN